MGVAQGSVISPFLFNVYLEPLLWELNKFVLLEDIFGYADDVLVLLDNIETLKTCTLLIENWSSGNNMKINKSKSGILEFIPRRKKLTHFKIGENFMGYPIVNHYKYLGTHLNQKLNLGIHLQYINKKSNFIRSKLIPILYNSSLDLRKNLWQIFIVPLFEFALPLYYYERTKSKRSSFARNVRNSFRSFTSLKNPVEITLVENLMGYDFDNRAMFLHDSSIQKCVLRGN